MKTLKVAEVYPEQEDCYELFLVEDTEEAHKELQNADSCYRSFDRKIVPIVQKLENDDIKEIDYIIYFDD